MKPNKVELFWNVDRIESHLLERSDLRIHGLILKNNFHCFELDQAGNDQSTIEFLQLLWGLILRFILTCKA
jgi:hypothetical protein